MRHWITRFGFAAVAGAWLALAAMPARADDWIDPRASADFPASQVVLEALALLGVPYRWGGDDPSRGLDCSGLVRHVFRSVGLDLPRQSEAIARFGAQVARHALETGDLVFFNTRGRRYSHVGIYIGDGRFVHAPARRGQVRVEEMDNRYWQARFNGARRLQASMQAVAAAEQSAVAAAGPVEAEATIAPTSPPAADAPAQ
jgi:hypothetical protein